MKRIGLAALSALAVLLVVSGPAVAKDSRGHHKRDARHEHRRSHRVRTHIVDIKPASPAAPTTIAAGDNAGTVASFTNGTLTLKLNNGTMVSGNVSRETEIECEAALSPGPTTTAGEGDGRDNRGGGDQSGDDSRDQGGRDDNGGRDEGGASAASCGSSALVAGAVVHEAELRVSSSGSTFTKVEVVQ
jgi:hypothetical protein